MASQDDINELLKKTTNYDKDERYMATNDLCNKLSNDNLEIDANLEHRICVAVLKQLDDTSNDVQSIAVKCLSVLVKKAKEKQVIDICDKLCNLIQSGKIDLRDIYSIGLKTCIGVLPEEIGPAVAIRLTPRLLNGITAEDENSSVSLECLDLLTDLLQRFGNSMEPEHNQISQATLNQLSNKRPVVRKRATACVGQLATVVSDSILNRIMESLLNQIETPREGQDQRTLIHAIGTMSRTVGFRLGSHLNRVIPLFLRFMKTSEDESMQNEAADELRENILHALGSFVLRCPREIAEHLSAVIAVSLEFLQYDPNYNYASDDEDEDEDMDDEDYYDDDEADYSDDDDTSWKVRRASVKVLTSIIVSRPELLQTLYDEAADTLLQRFKEREESVKLGILSCFTELIKATVVPQTTNKRQSLDLQPVVLQRQRSSAALLAGKVAEIMKTSKNLLKEKKAVKTKIGVFAMLNQLVVVLDGGLDVYVEELIPLVVACLHDRDSALKLESLSFVYQIFARHNAETLQPHVKATLECVVQLVSDDWYKVAAKSLRTIKVIIRVMRPRKQGEDMFEKSTLDYTPFVKPIYDAVLSRLSSHDIDQEIKDSAIEAMSMLLSVLGDELQDECATVLPLLLERLKNEITRMATLRAIAQIAESPLDLDLSLIVSDVSMELSQFLRQQSRTLKQQSFNTLQAIVLSSRNCQHISNELYNKIIAEASNLIVDADLHLCHFAIQLCIAIMESRTELIPVIQDVSLPKALALSFSPLLQGLTLDSLLDFLAKIASSGQASFDTLMGMLLDPVATTTELSKSAILSVAQCVAVLCVSLKQESQTQALIERFVADIKSTESSDVAKQVALLSIGEIGRSADLTKLSTPVHEVMIELFHSPAREDIKSAAAKALGNVAVGNMGVYLPIVMGKLESENEYQYLMLYSLREIISRHADNRKENTLPVEKILAVLEKQYANQEEGIRNIVAECLGKLAIINPDLVIPQLANKVASSQIPMERWTLVTCLKFTVAGETHTAAVLKEHIAAFFGPLKDDDLTVRRAALLTLNSTCHHQPDLIHEMLADKIVQILYEEMSVKDELKRKVDLGPFKHLVDDGLPLRKSAFSCVGTILDATPEVINVGEFLKYLRMGLSDVEDVQMLCHQILVQLCHFAPLQVIAHTDMLVDPLNTTLSKTIKDSLVGTEVERAYDVIRSALRALDAIGNIPEAKQERKVQELLQMVQKKDTLRKLMEVEKMHSLGHR